MEGKSNATQEMQFSKMFPDNSTREYIYLGNSIQSRTETRTLKKDCIYTVMLQASLLNPSNMSVTFTGAEKISTEYLKPYVAGNPYNTGIYVVQIKTTDTTVKIHWQAQSIYNAWSLGIF